MISKFLVLLFGSAWNIKQLCLKCQNKIIKKALILLWEVYQNEQNSGISWAAQFSGEPCFPHGMKGIFISGASKIGKNCVIFQHVTVGSNTLVDSLSMGAPVIGDDCYIGAGAVIVGNVRIGSNVRVGANATVYEDVPSGSVVVTATQKVIQKEGKLNNKYYSYCHDKWVYYDNGQWVRETDPAVISKLSAK